MLDHRVVAVDKFDDQFRIESCQPLDQFLQGDLSPNNKMMDESETQDELG